MKKHFLNLLLIATVTVLMTSCYSLSYSVGEGAQTGVEVTGKNHYLISGLVPLSTTSPTDLAKGASDYDVTVVHTFVDGLLSAITWGIYTPTTVIIQK